ncbi:MAG: DUF192 domain-containing protein [Aurantimonas endophytica]|uniref:DUF192 domain-containing protein n=1 Tax=Aurantimonas endophytica TaxID=1522175 RepID=A0A7W6MMZ9_9HYPH|nr:DUF192 domain-containing protein [Aurantimonas endophytica]MBB4001338.1 hypothetical protein [Aurantimonas endophytica]MCO6403019.1 DUF192 domain-containing protein [Aurantimonas endophytica]
MMLRKPLLATIVAAAAVLGAGYFAVAGDDLSEATLVTASGRHAIDVELATTPDTRATGLMNRESMPAGQGMLFDFGESRPVSMWMKNTLIPLDMLFIDDTGTVASIKTNAQPLSLDTIPSGAPVRYVLELNGGAASRYGVARGDRLEHEIIPAR